LRAGVAAEPGVYLRCISIPQIFDMFGREGLH
jgi:hypothetical protein